MFALDFTSFEVTHQMLDIQDRAVFDGYYRELALIQLAGPLRLRVVVTRERKTPKGRFYFRGLVFHEDRRVQQTRLFPTHEEARGEALLLMCDEVFCIAYDTTPRALVNGSYAQCELIRAGEPVAA